MEAEPLQSLAELGSQYHCQPALKRRQGLPCDPENLAGVIVELLMGQYIPEPLTHTAAHFLRSISSSWSLLTAKIQRRGISWPNTRSEISSSQVSLPWPSPSVSTVQGLPCHHQLDALQ